MMGTILQVMLILSLLACMVPAVAHNKINPLGFAAFFIFMTASAYFEYGVVGGLVMMLTLLVGIPVVVFLISHIVMWLLWQNIRKHYPDEPATPPGPRLTISGVYAMLKGSEPAEPDEH